MSTFPKPLGSNPHRQHFNSTNGNPSIQHNQDVHNKRRPGKLRDPHRIPRRNRHAPQQRHQKTVHLIKHLNIPGLTSRRMRSLPIRPGRGTSRRPDRRCPARSSRCSSSGTAAPRTWSRRAPRRSRTGRSGTAGGTRTSRMRLCRRPRWSLRPAGPACSVPWGGLREGRF